MPPDRSSFPTVRGEGIHGCLSSMASPRKIPVVRTWVLFPGPSLAPGCRERGGREGKSKTPFRGFYRVDNACVLGWVWGVFFTLFCSVIAPDGSGFSPGNGKAVLMLSWFSEERSLQTSCGLRVTSVTCSRFLTRGGPFFSPMPASSSRAALTGDNKPVFSGFFSCSDFSP